MDLYARFLRQLLWPAWELGVRGRRTPELCARFERTQWLDGAALLALQAKALRRLVAHAYHHVPYYRRVMQERGLRPEDLGSVEDLAKLPILTRQLARASVKQRTALFGPRVEIEKETSGTTGEPLLVGYERRSDWIRQAVKLRAYRWAGYELGCKALHFWGSDLVPAAGATRFKIRADRALKRELFRSCSIMSEARLAETARAIARHRPRAIVCYAQAGAELARYINERRLRAWGPIPVLCGAEPLRTRDRAALAEAFGHRVFETYGCRETMLIAAECEERDGLHTSMDNLVVEVLVPDGAGGHRPARPGERGEVVLTDLHNTARPFIRYAVGDLAVQGPDEPCRCGRGLRRLAAIEGRASVTLRNRRGEAVSPVAVGFLFNDHPRAVRQYQLVQHRDRSASLRLIPSAPGSIPSGLIRELERGVAQLLEGCRTEVSLVDELPRTRTGKLRAVVVEA